MPRNALPPLVALLFLLACGGGGSCTTNPAQTGADAAIDVVMPDAGPVVMTEDGTCVSTFRVTPECQHPVVVKQCEGEFCKIPHGCFVQGSPECLPWRGAVSEPEVQVTLTHDFEIGRHEVTQAEWVQAGFPNPSRPPQDAGSAYVGDCMEQSCPIARLSWFEAVLYTNARSRSASLQECYLVEGCTGEVGSTTSPLRCKGVKPRTPSIYDCTGYRLPTDSEWEYAARAGTRTPYYTGPMRATTPNCTPEPALDEAAWYCANVTSRTTQPVEKKVPNGWGLFDVLGNAFEWTSDETQPAGLRNGPYVDPGATLGANSIRTTRGGVFGLAPVGVTASNTLYSDWNENGGTGFRLARTLPGKK